MKKALSLLLCVCMLLPVFALCAQAADPVPCPTIYVRGSTKIYRFGEDGSAAAIYDDGDYVVNMLAKAAPLLPAARLTGDYTAYANKVLHIGNELFFGTRDEYLKHPSSVGFSSEKGGEA